MRTLDVNGTPKLLRRELLDVLELTDRKWCLDPELMIKAHYLGARVLEVNVFGRMRGTGLSNVRAETSLEFLRAIDYPFPEWTEEYLAAMESALGDAYTEPAADVRGFVASAWRGRNALTGALGSFDLYPASDSS